MNKNQRLIIVGATLIMAALIYFLMSPSELSLEYGDISIDIAKELIDEKPSLVILDVRTEAEFREGHIKGAINIPVDEIESRLGELEKEKEMLVYCRTGNRSSTAMRILKNNGFTKTYHMEDGITAWTNAGFPTVK